MVRRPDLGNLWGKTMTRKPKPEFTPAQRKWILRAAAGSKRVPFMTGAALANCTPALMYRSTVGRGWYLTTEGMKVAKQMAAGER